MEDQNLIKAKMRIKKGDETNNCLILVSQTRASRLEEKRERKKRKKRKEKKEKNKCIFFFFFCMESSVFWMSRVFGMNFPWMISYSFPRVLLGDKIILTLEFLKFCG